MPISSSAGSSWNSRRRTTGYDLKVLFGDGTDQVVLTGIEDQRNARYLEHRVEQHLGLVDTAVAGEYLG